MKLSHVLVACNENTKYLDFWPIVKESWYKVAQLPCIMIYVGDELPNFLSNDPAVKFFKAIPGWPTVTQAQCIRLLYPALLQTHDAVMVSDMDMIPLQRNYFTEGFEPFNSNQFVSLRGIDECKKQIYMCYVGATPRVWSELFEISCEQDITTRLTEWSQIYPSYGRHGSLGWYTDQSILYNKIKPWQELWPERLGLILKPWVPIRNRLCRSRPNVWANCSNYLKNKIKKGSYVDFHMPQYNKFSSIIHIILNSTDHVIEESVLL